MLTAMTTPPDIARVLRAWRAAGDLVQLREPADSAEIAAAERELGVGLPPEVRELYAACDGMRLRGGDLALHALRDTAHLSVATASRQLREWDWPVPDELVVVGDNGGGEAFGVWVVPGARRAPVVMMGSPGEEADLAVVGTTLGGFLAAWTAYYLPIEADGDPAAGRFLDEIGVPEHLRGRDDEEGLWALLAWASPGLPDPRPDPYERPLAPEEITRLARAD